MSRLVTMQAISVTLSRFSHKRATDTDTDTEGVQGEIKSPPIRITTPFHHQLAFNDSLSKLSY